jgi:hypothetical protein
VNTVIHPWDGAAREGDKEKPRTTAGLKLIERKMRKSPTG